MNQFFATFFLIASACSMLSAQPKPTTITVVGTYRYVVPASKYGLRVSFKEDPSKCDPAKGFLSLEEQLNQFEKRLPEIGIRIQEFTVEPLFEENEGIKDKLLSYTSPDANLILKIAEICREQHLAEDTYLFAEIPEHDFEAEDDHATHALKDAQKKATYLARKLGKRKVILLSIDDDTTKSRRSSNWDDWYAYYGSVASHRVYILEVTFEIQ